MFRDVSCTFSGNVDPDFFKATLVPLSLHHTDWFIGILFVDILYIYMYIYSYIANPFVSG